MFILYIIIISSRLRAFAIVTGRRYNTTYYIAVYYYFFYGFFGPRLYRARTGSVSTGPRGIAVYTPQTVVFIVNLRVQLLTIIGQQRSSAYCTGSQTHFVYRSLRESEISQRPPKFLNSPYVFFESGCSVVVSFKHDPFPISELKLAS